MNQRDRFNELQERWAAGEHLSSDEERERREGALGDPLAERELALFEELRERGDGVEELPKGFVERILAEIGSRPRLHLLSPGERLPAAALTPRVRRVWLVAAAVLVPVSAAAALFVLLRTPVPSDSASTQPMAPAPRLARSELVLASGDVTVPEGARVGGRALATGDRVSTAEGRACLGIDPGIDVCLGVESEIVLDSLSSDDVRIRVERGTALAALTRRDQNHSFALTAGDVVVTAHGTVFAVERRPGDALDVVVMEGAVEVLSRAKPALVSAHSRLTLERGSSAREPEAVGRGEEARFWALLAARELWAKPELGVLEVSAGEPGLELAVDREASLTLPFRAFVPAGRRSIALRTKAGDEVTTAVDVVAGETFVVDPNELLARRTAPVESAVAPTPGALLARARKELAAGNARAALAVYERLRVTHPTSPEARTVLVTIGKLELDLKQPARALASFDTYLAAPGALAPEALAGKIRALRALGRADDERRAIETYLARHPDGFDAPLLRQRLEVLQAR
jgi:hypothetical protein